MIDIQFDVESHPAAAPVGRCYREIINGKREMALMQLKRIRF